MLRLNIVRPDAYTAINQCNCKELGFAKHCGGSSYVCSHYNLKVIHPHIAEEWDYERNLSKPEYYTPRSNKKMWWICRANSCGCHKWQATIYHRAIGTGCPYCSNSRTCEHSNLLAVHPSICKEWDYTKNRFGPERYAPNSNEKIWWICLVNPCGCHNWEARIADRTAEGGGCPFCSENRRPCIHYNLLTHNPKICKEWDYENNRTTPDMFTPRSGAIVWWICKCNHRYQASIHNRTGVNRTGCPNCKESQGELLVKEALNSLNITFSVEYRLNVLRPFRFDFYFVHQGNNWLIEFDGKQHFKEIPHFHKEHADFEKRREIDKLKTYTACTNGYKLIRIDYTNTNEDSVLFHIEKALALNHSVYYSDAELYRWLNDDATN